MLVIPAAAATPIAAIASLFSTIAKIIFRSFSGLAGCTQKATDAAPFAHTSTGRERAEGFSRDNH
jgi:hypothetical protein